MVDILDLLEKPIETAGTSVAQQPAAQAVYPQPVTETTAQPVIQQQVTQQPVVQQPIVQQPAATYGQPAQGGYGAPAKDTFDYWGDPNVQAERVDANNMRRSEKSYNMVVYTNGMELGDAYKKKFLELATVLAAKGYKFRHTGNSEDALQSAILKIDGVASDSYLPWIKFNPNITTPKMKRPTACGYKIAAGAHKIFAKFKNGPRAVLARNVHATYGVDCKDPVNFIIAYTEDAAEGFTKGMDFKVTGDLVFYLNLAKNANIPVFNIKSDESLKRLIEYIKNN